KAQNAPFRTKYVVDAFPTLFIVDPGKETAVLRWVGGATVPQLEKLLDDGARAMSSHHAGLDEALARADRLYGAGKNEEAAKAFREVLSRAPPGWKPFGRATE